MIGLGTSVAEYVLVNAEIHKSFYETSVSNFFKEPLSSFICARCWERVMDYIRFSHKYGMSLTLFLAYLLHVIQTGFLRNKVCNDWLFVKTNNVILVCLCKWLLFSIGCIFVCLNINAIIISSNALSKQQKPISNNFYF